MKIYKLFKIYLVLFFSVFAINSAIGQVESKSNNVKIDNNLAYVKWISEYPIIKEVKKKPTFLRSLFELIVGKHIHQTFVRPIAVVANNRNDFIVLDQGCQELLKVKKTKIAIPQCIKRKENYFTSLVGICQLPDGTVFFTDSRLNKVFEITNKGKSFKVFNDTFTFQQPTGIAYCRITDEIWVVETNAHRVSVFDKSGKLIKTIGNRGSDLDQFNFPTSIWIDKNGDAYIVDALNFRVQIFDKEGKFINTFGEQGDVQGYFARPKGIATDEFGNIYVADAQLHIVQIFDKKGNFLYRFGSMGREKGQFWMPTGIYIDENNYIYVADMYNSRIQIFQLINGK